MVESVKDTSVYAEVVTYLDDDDPSDYGRQTAFMVRGPRIGPVASLNFLTERFPNFHAYGIVTDDSIVTTPAWDEWLLNTLASCPKRIGVVSPKHNLGEHIDQPFVSREWVEQVGFFACPDCYHYAWTIITGLIGEMTAIVHAPQDKFALFHDEREVGAREMVLTQKDEHAFFNFVALKLPPIVWRIREAMSK